VRAVAADAEGDVTISSLAAPEKIDDHAEKGGWLMAAASWLGAWAFVRELAQCRWRLSGSR
jgi:hypothetical protein